MPRRVVVSGASGLVGSALVASLRADGIEVTRLVRRPAQAPDEVEWLTDTRPLDPAVLAGADAVVNLNGASTGRFPWTAAYRSTLLWSRITPTRAIARALRALGREAPAFLSASAVGYYGSAPGAVIDEDAPRGESFLADLCGEWESAALGAGEHTRVTLLRTAPIVHRDGVLTPLILLTRAGLAGPIGRGIQVWPWISLDDEVRAIRHVMEAGLEGPVNLAAPTRTTANDLGFALAMTLDRPFVVRAPVWAMRLVLGRDATDAVLTADANVVPRRLEASGFSFRHPTIEEAWRAGL